MPHALILLAGDLISAARLAVHIGFSAPAPQQISTNAKVAGDTRLTCPGLAYQLDCFALKLFRKQPSFTCHVIPLIVSSYLSKVSVKLREGQYGHARR